MGLKKRSKISAEFNMSSLTDIIFLLLIFFMLTSSLVAPNALNLKLPGKSNKQTISSSDINDVAISSSGTFRLDGNRVSGDNLEAGLRRLVRKNGGRQLDITISPNPNAPIESVALVMDIAMRLNINAIMAVEE